LVFAFFPLNLFDLFNIYCRISALSADENGVKDSLVA